MSVILDDDEEDGARLAGEECAFCGERAEVPFVAMQSHPICSSCTQTLLPDLVEIAIVMRCYDQFAEAKKHWQARVRTVDG